MAEKVYVVCSIKPWDWDNFDKLNLSGQWYLIEKKDALSPERLNSLNPRFVFFTHWSWKIPKEIYEKYECVVFHPGDLPDGRGSSLIQHRIQAGIYHTKVSAIRVNEGFDEGDVYCKRDLCLNGNGEEIYLRLSKTVFEMLTYIVEHEPTPMKQIGEASFFKCRKPYMSEVKGEGTLGQLHDFIRMLDAETYPNAFIHVGKFRMEFSRPCLRVGKLIADVKIIDEGEENFRAETEMSQDSYERYCREIEEMRREK